MSPYHYNICGLAIDSHILLSEITTSNGDRSSDFHLELSADGSAPSCRWLQHYTQPDGETWLSLAGSITDFHLRFHELAHFHVNVADKSIQCYPIPDIPEETISHLFLDIVTPLILTQLASLVLHASAVSISGEVIAFLGGTGQGKSTITASLGQKGFPVLTDDCLVIEEKDNRFLGIPLYPSLRLWPEVVSALFNPIPRLPRVAHYTEKMRLGMGENLLPFSALPVSLHRLYVLDRHPETEMSRGIFFDTLSPSDAFMETVKHPYRLEIEFRNKLQKEFEVLGRLVNSIDIRRIRYPRDFGILPKVCEAILEDLGQ